MSYQDPYSQYPQQGGYAQSNPYSQPQAQEGYPQSNPYGQPQPQGGYAPPNPYASPNPYAQPQPQGMYGPSGQYGYQAPALNYVGVGPRFVAILIDTVILWVIDGVLGGIAAALVSASQNLSFLVAIIYLAMFVIDILYFFWLEATQGATLGKKAMGLKVVRLDGSPIGWNESIIRNLLRIVDGLFSYLVGAIIIWNSPLKQRLGDQVAKTVVVRTR